MPTATTSGFDLVMQLSTGAIEEGLERFTGSWPDSVAGDIELPGFIGKNTYHAKLALSPPKVDFVQTGGPPHRTVRLTATFIAGSGLELAGLIPGLKTTVTLESKGSIEITCPLAMAQKSVTIPDPLKPGSTTTLTGTALVAYPGQGTLNWSITSQVTLNLLGSSPVTVSAPDLQTELVKVLGPKLTALLKNVELMLTMPIPLGGVGRAGNLKSIDFSGFTGQPTGVAIGLLSACGGAGNAAGLAANPGAGLLARIQAANGWLVCLTCDALETAFPGMKFSINMATATGTFSGPPITVPAAGGTTFSITGIVVTAANGVITINGTSAAGGFCWSATPTFSFTIGWGCNPATGVLTPTASTPTVVPNVSISIWCIIAAAVIVGLILGALFGFIVGVVGAIVTGILLSSISITTPVTPATLAGLFGVFGGLTLPLPISSVGLKLGSCFFDDLEIDGQPVYDDWVPRRSSGTTVVRTGVGFDLDGGTTVSLAGGVPAQADLAWYGGQLAAVNGTELAVIAQTFEQVTYRELQLSSFGSTSIPASQIAVAPGAHLVFGARTASGLYARCAARRTTGGGLELLWVTYTDPEVSLDIESHIETVQLGDVVDSGSDDCGHVTIEPSPPMGLLMDFDRGQVKGPPGGGGDPYASAGGYSLPNALGGWGGFGGGGDPEPGGPFVPPKGGGGLPSVADIKKKRGTKWGVHISVDHESSAWELRKRTQRAGFRADPHWLSYPITCTWTVFGHTVPAGQTTYQGLALSWAQDSLYLEVETTVEGTNLTGQVCCTATDADGRVVKTCATVNSPGQIRQGGCTPSIGGMSFLDFQQFAREFPIAMSAMSGISGARAQLAAGVEAVGNPGPEYKAMPLQEAVRKLGWRQPG
jgi:hypothetical protein